MVLALCVSSEGPLSMYQVSFNSLMALYQCFTFQLILLYTFRDLLRKREWVKCVTLIHVGKPVSGFSESLKSIHVFIRKTNAV